MITLCEFKVSVDKFMKVLELYDANVYLTFM